MGKRVDRQEQESQRIIRRVQSESETGLFGRTMRRVENHIGASDADQTDWAELWGTRIGRTIGAVAVVASFVWFIHWLMGV